MDKENNILKQIFFDENNNWERFKKANAKSIRGVVNKEIEKFRLCGEKESGFSLYACEMCGDIKVVPHRCKGRFAVFVLLDILRNGVEKQLKACIICHIDILCLHFQRNCGKYF